MPGELLVGLDSERSVDGFATLMSVDSASAEPLYGLGVLRVRLAPGQSPVAAAAALKKLPFVRFVEPNGIAKAQFVPNDPAFVNQFNVKQVFAPFAWDLELGTPSTVIAIVDTGVDLTHPELASRLLPGFDYVNSDSDPSDDNGHGTLCAGVAAAEANNGIGLAGAAPGCSILPVKVLDANAWGSYSNIANGIRYAADRGANVISLSLAGSSPSSTLERAVRYAWSRGVIVIAAAGNQGSSRKVYPAAIREALAVASVDKRRVRSSFSNWGSWVDVAAPGEMVYSTYLNGGYFSAQGTSMSCALVAGQAGLIWSKLGSSGSPGRVRWHIESSAIPLGRWVARGHVNFYRSIL